MSPREEYTVRRDRHTEAAAAARSRSLRMSTLRVATFLALAGALLAFDVLDAPGEWWALGLAGALAAVFFVEVGVHRRIRRELARHEALAALASEGLLRLDRDWAGLAEALPEPERSEERVDPAHSYARDLDVTGRASLVRLAGPVTSERGRDLLRAWLLEPPPVGVADVRRDAVAELAGEVDLRHEFTILGRLEAPDRLAGMPTFFGWAESGPALLEAPLLRAAAWVLPALLVLTVVGDVAFGWGPWWLLVALPQAEAFRRIAKRVQPDFAAASAGGPSLRAYVPQLALLDERTWSSAQLTELARPWRDGGVAHAELARLSRLLDTVESRRNLVYATLAPVLLLDAHVAGRLDRWRERHGGHARAWIEALGEWEALSALATLAHDHPDWTFAEVDAAGPARLVARGLGHPLLPPDRCVRNDVEVGPPGTFLLVTGSNMSGKSTLLRALGANAVLASAGAPVCAASLALPPVRIHTSMRIDDSLAEGVSLFMAELLRVRSIVDAASTADARGRPVLYLLDEILHGTNTAERRVAARGVIRHLVASGAIGAVSTHDLTLAEAPDLARDACPVHFREQVEQTGEGTRLHFDHTLRDGIATTRNALKLLEAVGLGGLDLDEVDRAD